MTQPFFSRFSRMSIVAGSLALASFGACSDEPDPESPPELEAALGAGLQQVLDDAVMKEDVLLPGAIAYYRDQTQRVWSSSAGTGDMRAQTPMRSHDRIRAGSVLKTFLATVALQHVEQGRLSLDQTLPELLPQSVTDKIADSDRISLRMLLNHTSGVPDWVTDEVKVRVIADPARVWTAEEAVEIAAQVPPSFSPGTSWAYSNTNYTLVGMVLDRAGNASWREQVRERVLRRLDLQSTQLPEPGDLTVTGDYAHGYQDIDGMAMDLSVVDPSMAGAAGGHALVTTAADLARFLDALLHQELFEHAETLELMTTMIEAPHESGLPYAYGLGLESFRMPAGTTVIGHSGSTAGYTVMMFHDPERGITLVTAVNTNNLFTNALEVFIPALNVVTGPEE